jgi:hypothetical protein
MAMTEAEAKKIFDAKLPLCDVLGLDLRAECLNAGVPGEMIDKFLKADSDLATAMTRVITNPSALPSGAVDHSDSPTGETGFGFLCLNQKITGLPMIVWTMEKGDSVKPPYIRIQANHSTSPLVRSAVDLSIEKKPILLAGATLPDTDFAAAAEFIARNLQPLLDYWNGTISSLGLLKRISRSR